VVGSFAHLSLGCIALGSAARVGSPPRVLVDPHGPLDLLFDSRWRCMSTVEFNGRVPQQAKEIRTLSLPR
jgi:hypothetical protein